MPAWYVLNYKDGIGSRLLAGTLVNIFCGDYVTHDEALTFILISMLILIGLVSVFIGRIMRQSEKNRNAVLYFVGAFVTFVYFQLYSCLRYETLEATMDVLSSRTDMEIDIHTVRLEYFASLKENFAYGQGYFS